MQDVKCFCRQHDQCRSSFAETLARSRLRMAEFRSRRRGIVPTDWESLSTCARANDIFGFPLLICLDWSYIRAQTAVRPPDIDKKSHPARLVPINHVVDWTVECSSVTVERKPLTRKGANCFGGSLPRITPRVTCLKYIIFFWTRRNTIVLFIFV